MMRFLYSVFVCGLVSACAPKITPDQALATAYRYTQVEWMPNANHVRHGVDSQGIPVQTPDQSLKSPGGWWKPEVTARSVPYQRGGFDTPELFLEKIADGKKVGDIADSEKRKLGNAGTSQESCGIDCSGFVSRCWNLPRSYSTAELPQICTPLPSWVDLHPGDILLSNKHVVLFVKWKIPGEEFAAYEAGPLPFWRVNACGLRVDKLTKLGYAPWRYREMGDSGMR